MKHYSSLITAVLLTAGLAGCSEKGETPEPNAPLLDFSLAWEGDPNTLHYVEKASLQSTKLHEISGVKFYLGDELIGEDVETPFELSLDTELYEDGVYSLRVLVQANDNQEFEKVEQVSISNILLKMNIPPAYFYKGNEDIAFTWWLYLTDEHSNLIGNIQSGDINDEVIWKRPQGYTKFANLNILNTTEIPAESIKLFGLTTYQNYPLNAFNPQSNRVEQPASSGTLELNLINDSGFGEIQNFVYPRASTREYPSQVTTSRITSIPVQSENDKILVLQAPIDAQTGAYGDYRYHFVSGAPGTTKDVYYSQSQRPGETPVTISTPVTYANASSIWNIEGDFKQIPGYTTFQHELPTYISPVNNEATLAFVLLNGSHEAGDFALMKPAAEIGANADLPKHAMKPSPLDQGSFSLQSEGSADVYRANWFYHPGNDRGLYCQVYGQHENTTIQRPILPAEILAQHPDLAEMPQNLRLSKLTSTDYLKLDGYTAFFRELLLPYLNLGEYITIVGGYSSNTIAVPLEGQRIGEELKDRDGTPPQMLFDLIHAMEKPVR